ncbi:acetyl esterase [Pseudomonas taetrolens]|uniref:Esterase n=1 Tax=Pseudomonas taetrolens TaxID=47884 RepID=A0A0J6GUH6_PSETA|nr:alpha/beta hydrolase [Pseudomonas taetrolens]KMM85345.1 esterase [Pseudomonas taetrolens]SEC35160.1 acetyl esterase [Pseudomonas taetrolens]SQF86403.1 putative lipolytic enzyme [Pseudomonas taetrolens]VEH49480.1 putative lipolytic enzyme [Pseudomonas taetrolens]
MPLYPLDPSLQAYVDTSASFTPRNDTLSARRTAFAEACRHFTPPAPAHLLIDDQCVGGRQVRIYFPAGDVPHGGWPAVLYLHGGGWSMGAHDTHDWFAFALARRLQVALVAVDYRLAPEHPFPAPLEDALMVWLHLREGRLAGLSSERLAVAGDSAGGTLAAGLCVALRERGLAQPYLQALVYPVLSAHQQFASMHEHACAPMLTTQGLMASLAGYVPDESSQRDPQALALEQEAATGLAPAFVGVAQWDPLCDQGRAYVAMLRQAQVPAELYVGEGLVHASLRASGVAAVESFYDAVAAALRAALL